MAAVPPAQPAAIAGAAAAAAQAPFPQNVNFQDLLNAFAQLQTIMGGMAAQITALAQAQAQAIPGPPAQGTAAMKSVARPRSWNGKGDSAAARHFMAAFANWASAQRSEMNDQLPNGDWIRRDRDWIQAILNLMEEDARTWALPALEELRDGRQPYNASWLRFDEAFTRRFIPLDPAEAAREALKKLRQGKQSVAEFKARFDEQSGLTGWSDVDLKTRFYDGLQDDIKDALAISDRPTATLTELVTSAQTIDTRMRQRRAEKKGQTFHQTTTSSNNQGVVPMEIDATKEAETGKRNRQTWMSAMKGKCFGCGSTEHTKEKGGHDREICHHCGKTGHRSNVCFHKYMGKPKVKKANGTIQDSAQDSSKTDGQQDNAQKANATRAKPVQIDLQTLINKIEEQEKQIAALKASF
jgi:hypothetical protein